MAGLLASTPTPKYGLSPIGLPFLSMILASSLIDPIAFATFGAAFTRASSLAGTVGRANPSSELVLNDWWATTTASVPSYAALDSESVAFLIVSVNV